MRVGEHLPQYLRSRELRSQKQAVLGTALLSLCGRFEKASAMCVPSPLEAYSLDLRVIQCSGESPGQKITFFGGRLECREKSLNFLS